MWLSKLVQQNAVKKMHKKRHAAGALLPGDNFTVLFTNHKLTSLGVGCKKWLADVG